MHHSLIQINPQNKITIMKLMQNFRNDKTGEVYYKPIDLSLLNIISRFRAFVRVRI